jgi:hypothetical protein
MRLTQPFAVSLAFLALNACGRSDEIQSEDSATKIVRSESSIQSAPDIVRKSTVMLDIGGYTTCSGTIVAPDKILTAAHCVKDSPVASDIIVRFGPDMRSSQFGRMARGTPRVHPKLDLAVVRIDSIPASYEVAPIHPASVRLNAGDEVVIAGYGRTTSQATNWGEYLRWGKTKFTRFMDEIVYSDGQVFRSILQFNSQPTGSAVCGGDSGGPTYRLVNGTWGVLGVISGGPQACELFAESLTADARPNTNWILAPFNDTLKTCKAQASQPNGYVNLRYWDESSDTFAAISVGTDLRLEPLREAPANRATVRLSGYIRNSKTECRNQLQTCHSGTSVSDSSDRLGDVRGSKLYASASDEAPVVAVLGQSSYLRVVERSSDGWLKIDTVGTVSTNFCK